MSRFWISVDSLKRPPTLLTIPSSFSSSCISVSRGSSARALVARQQLAEAGHRRLQIVVDDHVLIDVFLTQFPPGRLQPPGDALRRLRLALPHARLVHLPARQL